MNKPLLSMAISAALLAGCQTTPEDPPRATAQLKPASGSKTIGEATFEQTGDNKVRIFLFAQGLKPNAQHAVHIHEVGDCSAPDASSAKGHFNPTGKPHGAPGSGHAGDLPMLKANAKGRGNINYEAPGLTVTSGPGSVVGRAIVIHADPDDFKSQPAGNSGARIACGVIRAG
ncbi:MAG TPA: superoxide dismutase family protein [Burkholderiales bacterium]|nr:superoxide dismutase family protein [Burkholderiales bacterium]